MNIKAIKAALSLGENERVEFVSSCRSVKTISKTVAAFLNTHGGVVVCGVDPDGKIIGVDQPETNAAKLEQQLWEAISPRSLIEFSVRNLEKKTVVVIEVPAGSDVPYACSHRFFFYKKYTNSIFQPNNTTD